MSILKVNNFTKKSFTDYTGPIEGEEFKMKNVIFGYNGRGKSSLAVGIINEFFKDTTKSKDNYRFFDKNFIKENLVLKEDNNEKLKGVIANFGKKAVDTEKKIEELEKSLIDINELEKENQQLEAKIRKEVEKIYDSKRGKSKIQKPPSKKTISEILNNYNKYLRDAKKIEPSEEKLEKISGDNSLTQQKEQKQNLNIPVVNIINDAIINEISEIADIKYDDIKIPATDIIQWLNSGMRIHNDGDTCKFCEGKLDYMKLKSKVNKYNSNEKQKAILKLTNFKNNLIKLKQELSLLLEAKNSIISTLETDISTIFENIATYIDDISEFNTSIEKKIGDINIDISIKTEELKIMMEKIYNDVEIIVETKNKEVKDIENKLTKSNALINGAIGLEISKNTFIATNHIELTKQIDILNNAKKENININKKINELKQSKSNTNDFAMHINEILKMLEVNLKLEVLDGDYIIKHAILSNVLTLQDISEGEQNLLSLLYFYYELFEDMEQKKLKKSIELIVVDDPISSVDDINKMYVLELIKKTFAFDKVQIFIFTHVWEDFCNICYGKKDHKDASFRFYEIKKNNTMSSINVTKVKETPYKHNFKEIYDFSQKKECTDLDDCEIYHYPNIMRTLLEEFLSFKVNNNSPTENNRNNIENVLCNNQPTNADRLQVGALLNVCNILSHKASRRPDEILKAAKFLMNKIEVVDKLHFDTNKQ